MDISARELKGHDILAVERFWDNTRWMIEFSVLRPSTCLLYTSCAKRAFRPTPPSKSSLPAWGFTTAFWKMKIPTCAIPAVSYTHLDVYKRQAVHIAARRRVNASRRLVQTDELRLCGTRTANDNLLLVAARKMCIRDRW